MPTPGVIGVVTIGQTPRPDLEEAFSRHAGGVPVEIVGALDGFSPDEIERAAAHRGEYPLLVRLADSTTREIPLELLHPLVQARARQLAGNGAAVVAVACAGGFPDVECDVPVLLPGRILPALAAAIVPDRRVGVVVPIRAQARAALRKWSGDGFDPVITWASPHAKAERDTAIAQLRDRSLRLAVLDCFGHGAEFARDFARRAGMPVLAAQSVTARLAGELVTA